ncbi:MAG: hypothetical protein QOG10_7058 [Kribbellaceae bacterium]|jgi:acyl-CoA synthetase (NDP forming)|nr:hypothetical protein [Kribbellaceae bacterium]
MGEWSNAEPTTGVPTTFWSPRSVLLLGVSRNPLSVTARPALYLTRMGFSGKVSIVHAEAVRAGQSELHGHPVYARVADLQYVPDVAMVMLPAADVPSALHECASAGVKGAVVIASGFEGADAQETRAGLHTVLADHPGFRVVGPNSVGSLATSTGAALTFSTIVGRHQLRAGSIGLVTQSGALGNGLLLGLHERGAGVSQWVSTGDEVDLGALETTRLMLQQEDTRAVGLFLEGIADGDHRALLGEVIRDSGKRVVAMKSARSAAGRAAAVGHTGRVVGDGEIAVAALQEIGVDIVSSLEELLETLTALAVAPPPPQKFPARVAVVTVSGGAGVLAADEIQKHTQLSLAAFGDDLVGRMKQLLPSYVNVANPLDVPVIDDPSLFERVLAEVAAADGVDATIAVVSSMAHDYETLARSFRADGSMRILTHLGPTERFSPEQAETLASAGVAALQSPIHAASALAVWAGRSNEARRTDSGGHSAPPGAVLGYARAASRLSLDPAHLPPMAEVGSMDEALDFATAAGGPIVLKAEGSAIVHRSELGAVKVGLEGATQIAEAYVAVAAICAEHGDVVLAQEMSGAGTEVMVSVVRDPEIGVVGLARLGGIFVELGPEGVVFTALRTSWDTVLSDSSLGRVLAGYRGGKPSDVEALFRVINSLMRAVENDPSLLAVEANPVVVRPVADGGGAFVVDLAAYLNEDEEK